MKAAYGIFVGFAVLVSGLLAGAATMLSNVERIGATWSPALDAVCGLFLDVDLYNSKPSWPCVLSKSWEYHNSIDDIIEKRRVRPDPQPLDYGQQCYQTEDCPPDLTNEKARRCWSLDGYIKDNPSNSGYNNVKSPVRFCLAYESHCPFPGSSGLETGEIGNWGSSKYICRSEGNGEVKKRYYIEKHQ